MKKSFSGSVDEVLPSSQKKKSEWIMTNPTGHGVVDVKTCNTADTGPCGHGDHEEEKKACIRSGKGEEGRQGVYRAYT